MNPKILCIEDEEDFVTIFTHHMKDLGIEVFSAGKLETGVRMIQDGLRPDLVLLDLVLPDSRDPLKTLEVIPKLKSIWPNIKVITATGFGTPIIMETAQALGSNLFADKQSMGKRAGSWAVIKQLLDSLPPESGSERAEIFQDVLSKLHAVPAIPVAAIMGAVVLTFAGCAGSPLPQPDAIEVGATYNRKTGDEGGDVRFEFPLPQEYKK